MAKTKRSTISECIVHKNTEIWIPSHNKKYKAKVIGLKNNRPGVSYVNWNKKYVTTFYTYSVWIRIQMIENLSRIQS